MNGRQLITVATQNPRGTEAINGRYEAALYRADIELGYSQIPTATIDFVGKDAALFLTDNVQREDIVEIEAGYEDQEGIFNEFRKLFRGVVIRASMEEFDPLKVQLHIDGPSFKMREYRGVKVEAESLSVSFLKSLLQNTPEIGLTVNFDDETPVESGEIARTTGTDSALDHFNSWVKSHGFHWYDKMDGTVVVIFPGSDGEGAMKWEIPLVGGGENQGTYEAPIISEWGVRLSHVDIPGRIEAPWRAPGEVQLRSEIAETDIEDGLEGQVYRLPPLLTEDLDAAQIIVDRLADNFRWRTIMGPFALKVGIPMMPFDSLRVTNGPEGIDDVYDRDLRVIETHHILDPRGWQVKGEVRAVI